MSIATLARLAEGNNTTRSASGVLTSLVGRSGTKTAHSAILGCGPPRTALDRQNSPGDASFTIGSFPRAESPQKGPCVANDGCQFCSRGASFNAKEWNHVPCPTVKELFASRLFSTALACPARPCIARSPKALSLARSRSASTARDGMNPPSTAGLLIRGATGRTTRDNGKAGLSAGLRLVELALEHLRTVSEKIEMVGPVLHHPDALVPIFAARVGAAHGVVVAMGKLPLDCVGMP